MQLPQQLALILPLVVAPLAGWLGDDGLPVWVNELFALIALAATVAAWVFLGGKFSNDVTVNIMLIAGYTGALVAGPLAPLHKWFIVTVPSPFAALAPKQPAAVAAKPTPPPLTLPRWAAPTTTPTATTSSSLAQSGDDVHAG